MSLKIIALSKAWENNYWQHINSQDPYDYFFFIADKKFCPKQTEIYLAVNDTQKICGLMLIFDGFIVQLRGSRQAVKLLLESLKMEKVELSAPINCRNLVSQKYPLPFEDGTMVLMLLKKGNEKLEVTEHTEKLGLECAEEIADLLRQADPRIWGQVTAEDLKAIFKQTIWLGIRKNGKLVSLGISSIPDQGSHIIWVATQKNYQNKGYATSIVSSLLEILLKNGYAIIFTLSSNLPAIKTYTKIGFEPYRSYAYIKT